MGAGLLLSPCGILEIEFALPGLAVVALKLLGSHLTSPLFWIWRGEVTTALACLPLFFFFFKQAVMYRLHSNSLCS